MKHILSIGFDLDNTLFKPNAEIDEKIRSYACQRAGEILQEPYEKIRNRFDDYYKIMQSGRRSLQALGIKNSKELMQEALEKTDIISLLSRDERLHGVINRLSAAYKLFLITGGNEEISLRKLEALGIEDRLFDPKLYSSSLYKRIDGSAFVHVSQLHQTSFSKMMFVGDREEVDILPAKKLGLTTAIVNATSAEADYQLQTIYQIEEIVSRL